MLEIIECPRDAMQGIHDFIPTTQKINYINKLLDCGFHTIDFGSFVSPKVIPQLRDTAEVLGGLAMKEGQAKLLAIIANERGAQDASHFDAISLLGYPFSVSETFQKRNTNASIEESLGRVEAIKKICDNHSKTLVVYLSMAFGNPYGEPWHPEIVAEHAHTLVNRFGIEILALSDTIGSSQPETINALFSTLISALPNVTMGAHLHTTPETWREKIHAAYQSGCRRFDGAIKGFGGCPMAADDLTGNMPTERMLEYFQENGIETNINRAPFEQAQTLAAELMG